MPFHVEHAAIANFYVNSIKNFMELVLWWEVFVYQFHELFFNVVDNIVIKKQDELHDFTFS